VYFAKEQVLLFGFSVVIVVDDDVMFFLLWSKQGTLYSYVFWSSAEVKDANNYCSTKTAVS